MTTPSAAATATAAALEEAYAVQQQAVREQLLRYLTALWAALTSWRTADADRFAAQAAVAVTGGQQRIAALTGVHLARTIRAGGGKPGPTPRFAVSDRDIRGVPAEQVYRRPFEQIWTDLSRGVPLDRAVAKGEQRMRATVLTDLQLAKTHASRKVYETSGDVVGYRRVLNGDSSCALCVVASTQRYHKGDLLPIHPGCVPGETLVRARNISIATRRWYSGELAVITTAAGDQVAVTPKHPILTNRGWVPGDAVRPQDHLFRSGGGQRVVGHGPDERDTPVLAEQVWRALSVAFDLVRMPLAAEDFHGDGSNGEVDVVRTDGYFSTVGNPQGVRKSLFVPGHRMWSEFASSGNAATLVPLRSSTTGRAVRGSSLGGPLLGAHLRRTDQPGFGGASTGDACLNEPPSHHAPTDPLLVSDGVFGESPVEVVGPELLDRVVDVDRVRFAGHVYNFQCESGTYEANSHIVHNCDCSTAPLFGHQPAEQVIDPQLLSQAHAAVRDLLGTSDSGGRAPDYRQVMLDMTHQHGELGPLLARPRDRFTGPDALTA